MRCASSTLVDTYADGRIKLHVTRCGLAMRREAHLLFLEGTYRPIDGGEHVVAFERAHGSKRLVCIAPRLTWKLAGEPRWPLGEVWGDPRHRGRARALAERVHRRAVRG
ncbi:MAG: hypothetical protein H0T79_23790 [Deltaproteobacteria bacterium]|nr:hypothetical protein [Deltaproteobacteria bacterium]